MQFKMSRFRQSSTGQALPNSDIGFWVSAIASDPEVRVVVEIGTWKGGGTTECIRRGFLNRSERARAVCLESNHRMAAMASRRHRASADIDVLWGSVVSGNELDREELSNKESEWLEQDLRALADCPQVGELIPDTIDFLILDGGEFSTYSEWCLLGPRTSKWCVVDDTLTRKGRRIVEEVRDGNVPWVEVVNSSSRNGFSVLMRRG